MKKRVPKVSKVKTIKEEQEILPEILPEEPLVLPEILPEVLPEEPLVLPEVLPEVPEEPVKKRTRGRKKKCPIDSLAKLRPANGEDEKVVFNTVSMKNVNDNVEEKQVAFGALNITVHSVSNVDNETLRKMYDTNFKLSNDEKAPSVIQQKSSDIEYSYAIKKNMNKGFRKVHKILETYSSNGSNKWPEKTDLLCWWCAHKFDTVPVPCPVAYDKITDKFQVKGIFCSFSCVAAYSIEYYKSLYHVYLLRSYISESTEDIVVAPNRIVLKSFGGPMSIEEYRALDLRTKINISTEYISYINQEILEIRN
jgi:hypothetical protein